MQVPAEKAGQPFRCPECGYEGKVAPTGEDRPAGESDFNLAIEDEFEPWERAALNAQPGQLDRQTAINAMWRIEGLTVLAWALGRAELLPYDRISDVDGVWEALSFLNVEKVRELLTHPRLRPTEELEKVRKQMPGYHWRLRDFHWSKPAAMMARSVPPLDQSGFDHASCGDATMAKVACENDQAVWNVDARELASDAGGHQSGRCGRPGPRIRTH